MRLEINAYKPTQLQTSDELRSRPNKHAIQGLIYELLKGTEFSKLHDKKQSKFFTFSDWFPTGKNGMHRMFLSSPTENLVETIKEQLNGEYQGREFKQYIIVGARYARTNPLLPHQTASPVVLVREGGRDAYHSFRKGTIGLNEFDNLVKTGAVAKFRAYTDDPSFDFDGPLFAELELKSEVAVPIRMRGRSFPIIGSQWKTLKFQRDPSLREFFTWLVEVGIGQKTSLGFGFLQPKGRPRHHTSHPNRNRTMGTKIQSRGKTHA